MSNQPGLSVSAGEVSFAAVFHGTARLVHGPETTSTPEPARRNDLQGAFHADLDISFALLLGVGFVPVDPSHPAYPLYLAASASPEPAAQPATAPGVDPLSPDAVTMPFETVVTIPADTALRYGLMAPGPAASNPDAYALEPAQPVRRRPVPPPSGPAGRKGQPAAAGPPAPIGDFTGFLDFMGDPERHPLQTDTKDAPQGAVDVHTQAGIDYLQRNARERSGGLCGHALNEALRAEGLDWKNVNYAKDFGPQLRSSGFETVSRTGYQPRKGDIAVVEPYAGGNVAGHVAMWDGRIWVSDFKQQNKQGEKDRHGFYTPYPGGGYRDAMPSYSIYRR